MAYSKKTWKDRITEYPNRRELTHSDSSTELVTVARSEGTISQEGDAFSAQNMNDLEGRIDSEFSAVDQNLQGINDNLTALETRIAKVTVSDSTRISLTPNTEYVTLADGYFRIVCTQGTTTYVDGAVNGSVIIRTTVSSGSASGINGIYVKKGSTIKCILSASGVGSGYFYPLS